MIRLPDPGRRVVWRVDVLDPDPPRLRRRGAAVRRAEQLAGADGAPRLRDELARRGILHVDRLRQLAAKNYFPPFYFAVIAANLGDSEQAFEWLDKAYQERSGWMPWLKHEPLLDSLSQDARFNDLLRRVGLEP